MANIVIRELLPSDTFSALVDKVNYNFDQLLLSGGGPAGQTGGLGDMGPMGISGTRMYTVIDIVDKTTDTPVTPILPGDPNKYYPVALGAVEKIGSLSKPLRHNDLYVEEGDDDTLGNAGLDGDIWIYSVILNSWVKTGNNIKGEIGNTGAAGLSEWTRDLTFQAEGRDYLYITDITGVPTHKLALGSFVNISEDNGTGGTMDPESIVNITTDISTGSSAKYAISIGDVGANASEYAKITTYSGILYLKSPNYGTNSSSKSIYVDAYNKITLNSGSNIEYIGNEMISLGSDNIASHYFTGAPVNIELSASNDTDFFRVARTGRSAFIVYPTTSTVTDRIHIYPISANISPKNNTNADKDLVIKINSTTKVGLGPVLTTESMGAMLSVKGNGIIGPSNTSTPAYPNFFAHNPGFYSFAVYNKIGIGTRHGLDGLNSYNQHGSKLVIGNIGNSSDSPTILLQNSENGITGLYFQNINWSGSTWNVGVEGSLLYTPSENIMRLAVSGHNNAIHITSDGNVAIDYQMGTPYKLAVSGTARFLCTDSNPNSGFEILTDNHTTEGITDNVRPIRRGIVVGKDEIFNSVLDNYGFVNFYKHSSENSSYFHTSDMFPLCIDTVDSSRFNFRTYEHSTPLTLSLMSIRGYDKNSVAVQIGTEYNLDTTRTSVSPERPTFKHTAFHVRKDTSGNSNILTTLLSQNDVSVIPAGFGIISDMDFFATSEQTGKYLKGINVPQARIRVIAGGSGSALTEGNLEFYVSTGNSSTFGDNKLVRGILIDSKGDVTFGADLNVPGHIYFGLNPPSVATIHYLKGNPGSEITIMSGRGYAGNEIGKNITMAGGAEHGNSSIAGNVYIIGGGQKSFSTGAWAGTGSSIGGNVYITGGAALSGNLGFIKIGKNPFNTGIDLLSAIYLEGETYVKNTLTLGALGHTTYLKGDMFVVGNKSITWGTVSPTSRLNLVASVSGYPAAYMYNTATTANSGVLTLRTDTISGNNFILKAVSGPSETERFSVKDNGFTYISDALGINTTYTTYSSTGYDYHTGNSSQTWTNGPSVFVKLAVNGTIACTAILTASDANLKENIINIENPLKKILNLRPVFFNWKENGQLSCGFIAQEVEEYIPEAVLKSITEDGSPGKYVLKYDTLYTFAIGAIQEQQKLIEEKDDKIAELEERLAKIEKLLNI